MNRKTKIVIVVILAVILALAGYFGYKKYFNKPMPLPGITSQTSGSETPTSTPETPNAQASTLIAGFKLYKNANFGFEIQYPNSWTVSEEDIVNVRGENTKGFFFKKPNSDLRFAILPRDGLSYGLPNNGTSENINIGGFPGVQTKYIMPDGRRLLLVHPQTSIFNWDSEIGRLDIESSVENPAGDFVIFNKMLNSFKLNQ